MMGFSASNDVYFLLGVLELRSMFLVTVRARPTEHAEDEADVGGGYVNCWLSAATEDEAIARALAEVRDAEWIAEAVETVEAVTRETYADPDHPGRVPTASAAAISAASCASISRSTATTS